MRIRKDDKVIVLSGKDKGKTGKVVRAIPVDNKVVVEGVNTVKKHQKPSMQSQGGIVTKEMPIQVSNVAHIDPESGKATRVRYEHQDGKKVRVAIKSGKVIGS